SDRIGLAGEEGGGALSRSPSIGTPAGGRGRSASRAFDCRVPWFSTDLGYAPARAAILCRGSPHRPAVPRRAPPPQLPPLLPDPGGAARPARLARRRRAEPADGAQSLAPPGGSP